MATRFYLPSSGTPEVTPPTPTGWTATTGWAALPAPTSKTNTSLSTFQRAKGGNGAGDTTLNRVFVSERIGAGAISGTFSAVMAADKSSSTANAWLEIRIKVVSEDGQTVRGTLYAGSPSTTHSTTAGAENENINISGATRIKNALSLSSVTAQNGDRIQIEVGFKHNSTGTSVQLIETFGDPSATADFALTSGLTTSGDPWVELSADLATFVDSSPQTVTPNAITRSPSVSAPTVTPGALDVTPAAITRSPTVTAPTVTPGALAVTPSTTGAAATAVAPTVTPGALSVTPNTVGSPATVVAPSATPGALTTTPSGPVGGPASLLGVTVDIGPPTIRPDGPVGQAATPLAPTVTGGPITVGPDAATRTPSVASPAVTSSLDVTPDPIEREPVALEPTVTGGPTTVSPELVGGPAVLFAPRVKDSGDVVTAYIGGDPLTNEAWDPREPKKWNGSAWVKAPVHVID